MTKGFRYDGQSHQFLIGRNEVGDFGLHLGLIRSFSWGNNIPPQSPFYPGKPLPYHFLFDFTAGFLERIGLRIDYAVNGLSAVAFTLLLTLIYKLSQLIFGKSMPLGITSVLLYIFPSSVTFLDFFKNRTLSWDIMKQIWTLPDYIHKGPFDGSLVSIYFTPAVYLNQRHLIVGLLIGLCIFYFILKKIIKNQQISTIQLIFFGLLLGASSRVHSLVAAATTVVIIVNMLLFRKFRWVVPFLLSTATAIGIVYGNIANLANSSSVVFNIGFLSSRPFTLINFLSYWWANLWLVIVIAPIGIVLSNTKQKKIFLSFFTLFIIANVFQLSFRIEHNHSLINYFLIITNFYVAFILVKIWKRVKFFALVLFLLLTASGILNLMAVKNDYLYPVSDAPKDHLIQWIKDNTTSHAIFLAKHDLYDPVTIAGRRNYFGATYYLQVMGYDYARRQDLTKRFFEANDKRIMSLAKQEGIDYIIIPVGAANDFPYHVHRDFFQENYPLMYTDTSFDVYQL